MNFYDKTYNFLKYKTFFISISLILFLRSVCFFAFKGLNYGVDFKGGTVKFCLGLNFFKIALLACIINFLAPAFFKIEIKKNFKYNKNGLEIIKVLISYTYLKLNLFVYCLFRFSIRDFFINFRFKFIRIF